VSWTDLKDSPRGKLVDLGHDQYAFVPNTLPRRVELDDNLIYLLDEASRGVATLAGVGETLPNPSLLINPFMQREALLSSRIEGTQASLEDVFVYETQSRDRHDAREVSNYVRALEAGLELVNQLPIGVRFINVLHETLLSGVRGQETRLGKFRDRQVWIGTPGTPIADARYVPPPDSAVLGLIGDWERFVNERIPMPPLVQCALMHYQFEAIHPYTDGNGRVGRLLISVFLKDRGVLPTPLLYLSAYFERDRQQYYDQLFRVSATGDWAAWLRYFLAGVVEQATDALLRSRKIRDLQDRYRSDLQRLNASANALRLADLMFTRPYITARGAAESLGLSDSGTRSVLQKLVAAGILRRTDGWPRMYMADEIVNMIQGPLP